MLGERLSLAGSRQHSRKFKNLYFLDKVMNAQLTTSWLILFMTRTGQISNEQIQSKHIQ